MLHETDTPGGAAGQFAWTERRTDDVVVFALSGELDLATAGQLQRLLTEALESSPARTIVLDLSQVRFIDAESVGRIVVASATARAHGRSLCVDRLHGTPARVFELLGLTSLLCPQDDGGKEETPMAGNETSELGGPPLQERTRRAFLWEAGADERERLADEHERLADEREALADDRDRLANRHEQALEGRGSEVRGVRAGRDREEASERAETEAALRRAKAAVQRAEAQLLRAQAAAARVQARIELSTAGQERATATRRADGAVDDDERAWLADRRDFVAAEREMLAAERDQIADQRDEAATEREWLADARERELLQRVRRSERRLPGGGSTGSTDGFRGRRSSFEHAIVDDERRRESATAERRAAASERARAAADWGPQAYGPMLVASFAELARQLFALDELHDALHQVLKFTVGAVDACDWASVTVYQGGRITDGVSSEPVAAELDHVQLRTGSGPVIEAPRVEQPIYVPRLTDPSRWPQLAAAATRLGAASALCHGLFVHHPARWTALGVFSLYSATPDAFAVEDQEFAAILAAYLSVAVAMAQRREEVDHREAALHRGLSTRDVIGQAKGILMERQRLSAGDAFDVLRHASQRLNRKLVDVAEHLAQTGELPG